MRFRKDSEILGDSIGFQGTPVDSRGFQGIFVDSEDSSLLGFLFQTIIIDAFSLPILFVSQELLELLWFLWDSWDFSGVLRVSWISSGFLGFLGDSWGLLRFSEDT